MLLPCDMAYLNTSSCKDDIDSVFYFIHTMFKLTSVPSMLSAKMTFAGVLMC